MFPSCGAPWLFRPVPAPLNETESYSLLECASSCATARQTAAEKA